MFDGGEVGVDRRFPQPDRAVLGRRRHQVRSRGACDAEHRRPVSDELVRPLLELEVPDHDGGVGAAGDHLLHVRVERHRAHTRGVTSEGALKRGLHGVRGRTTTNGSWGPETKK